MVPGALGAPLSQAADACALRRVARGTRVGRGLARVGPAGRPDVFGGLPFRSADHVGGVRTRHGRIGVVR